MNKTLARRLLNAAAKASRSAYAPYSKFHVGAALLGADGKIYTGCNVENASYGLTICAERNAVFHAVTSGCSRFTAVAVTASGRQVPYPCGACRQVLAEFCGPETVVLIASVRRLAHCEQTTLGDLLPKTFRL